MTVVQAGNAQSLVAEWYAYVGGPASAMTGVTIGITSIATGAVALAPTAVGITAPATGINVYSWAVPSNQPGGDYLVAWSGVDPQGDTVNATEVVTVTVAGTAYASLATLKAMLSIVDSSRDTLLTLDLATATEQVDRKTGRSFLAASAATTRTVPVAGNLTHDGALIVPDISSVTDLALTTGTPGAWTSLVSTSYYVAPEDALVRGYPVSLLRAAYLTTPWAYSPYVQVTARWGWPAVPAAVQKATLLLASRLYARRLSPEGIVVGSQDWGGIRVTRTDADVFELLSPYMLPGFA